jgi:uncharacterized membrane protein
LIVLILILGLVLFLGTHGFTTLRDQRATVIANKGEGTYKGLYTGLSLLGFVLIIWGYGAARASGAPDIWYPPGWTRHLAALLMLPVFVLLAAAYLPGRIKAAVKHPMILAVKIWATAHLISNGDLASILLFGSFLAWGVYARISMKRRDRAAPAAAMSMRPRADLIALVAGILAYLVFAFWLHRLLIGVSITGRV